MKKRILCMAMVLCMVMTLLPVTALAESAVTVKRLVINTSTGNWTNYYSKAWTNTTFTRAYYGKTAADGKQMDWNTASASDYNIKVEETANGLEITLKDAKLIRTTDFLCGIIIHYEGDVTITLIGENEIGYSYAAKDEKRSVSSALYVSADSCTITGTGSLKAYGDGSSLQQYSANSFDLNNDGVIDDKDKGHQHTSVIQSDCDLIIKDVTLDVDQICAGTTDPWVNNAVRCKGDLTIDGATVDIYAQYGRGIHIGSVRGSYDTDSDVTITNGAKVNIESAGYAVGVGSGNLYIDTVNGATEVTLKGKDYAFKKTPVLQGNYAATAATVKDGTGAVEYTADPTGGVATTAGQYRYFHLEEAEPEIPEVLVAPVLNNTLDMDIAVPKTAVDATGYAMFVPEAGGEPIRAGLVEEEEYMVARLTGLAAKQMTDSYTVTVYNAAGEAVSQPKTFSIADYILDQLEKTDDEKLKTLLVDMLIYGEMAQNQFGYNTEKPAAAGLSDEQLALATKTMEPCENTIQTATGYKGTNFILENSIAMATAYDKAVVGEGAYAIVTFVNHKGVQVTSDKIYETAAYSNEYNAVFISNDLVAADGRCDVTWTIYDAQGAEVLHIVDSLESYTKRALDAGDTFVEKVMIYADSAEAYFNR